MRQRCLTRCHVRVNHVFACETAGAAVGPPAGEDEEQQQQQQEEMVVKQVNDSRRRSLHHPIAVLGWNVHRRWSARHSGGGNVSSLRGRGGGCRWVLCRIAKHIDDKPWVRAKIKAAAAFLEVLLLVLRKSAPC